MPQKGTRPADTFAFTQWDLGWNFDLQNSKIRNSYCFNSLNLWFRRADSVQIQSQTFTIKWVTWPSGFPSAYKIYAQLVKNMPANARDTRDTGSIPGPGRSCGEGNSNSLQFSCLENSMKGGAWQVSMGLQRVGLNWVCVCMHTHTHSIV